MQNFMKGLVITESHVHRHGCYAFNMDGSELIQVQDTFILESGKTNFNLL